MIRRKKASAGTPSEAGQGFPPHALRDYALLADGERGAIIGPRGEIAWLCAPAWHSGSIFSSLIGGRSVYAICPVDRFVWGGFYEPRSLIWRSRWVTETGSITECRVRESRADDREESMRGCKVEAAVDVLPVEMVASARARAMRSPVALREPGRNEARSDCCQAHVRD
jgi:alpha,alpha-trehalase